MKNLALCFLTLIVLIACKQQKIGFVDNVVLINEYQERIDVEFRLQVKINAFKTRTDSLRSAFELEIKEKFYEFESNQNCNSITNQYYFNLRRRY